MQPFAYDAAGNLTQTPSGATLSYDSENRLSRFSQSGSTTNYYNGVNGERLFDGTYWYLYGPDGYQARLSRDSSGSFVWQTDDMSLSGKQVVLLGKAVLTDRVGSLFAYGVSAGPYSQMTPAASLYYPYGQPPGVTYTDRELYNFATYANDGNGLYYAKHRYYDFARGRFTSPDPAASGTIARPNSWNRYAYTEGDPVNFNDPEGLFIANPWYQTGQNWMDIAIFWGSQPYGYLTSSNAFTKAANNLGNAVTAIEERRAVSADCDKDLAALSTAGHTDVSLNSIQGALASTNFSNGGSSTLPVSALFGPGAEAAGRAYQGQQDAAYGPGQTIGNEFARNPNGLTAETVLGGSTIFINPALIGGNLGSNQSLLFHEAIHELGLVDQTIQEALGLKVDPKNTKSISDKLFKDCFTGKGNRN